MTSSADASIPAALRYTKDHEWAKSGDSEITVGITQFAVEQLGDITLVNIDVKVGDSISAGKAFGTIESVKTLSDLYAPVSGKVARINAALESKPELVNESCYGDGWLVVISPTASEFESLMDANAYREHVKASAH